MNTFNTKVSKSKQGPLRFPKNDTPFDNSVKTMKLTPEQMDHYLKTGELPQPKRGRGRPPKMKPEQAQEMEKEVTKEEFVQILDKAIELKELEDELAKVSQNNVKLKQELDDLIERYNQLSLDYETAEQVKYDLTRTEGQLEQVRRSKKETDKILDLEVNKREALEQLVRLYV